jgi:hypothetical protein
MTTKKAKAKAKATATAKAKATATTGVLRFAQDDIRACFINRYGLKLGTFV